MPTPYTIEDDFNDADWMGSSNKSFALLEIWAYPIYGTKNYQFDTLVVYHYANPEQHQ